MAVQFLTEQLFPTICNMSLAASAVIGCVLLVRIPLKKAPKVFSFVLWTVVWFRLLCPISVSADISLLGALGAPAREQTAITSTVEYRPVSHSAAQTPQAGPAAGTVSPAAEAPQQTGQASVSLAPRRIASALLPWLWLSGVAAMALCSAVSLFRLHRRLIGSVRLRDNIYLADSIDTPFVIGLFRPKIYLPSSLPEPEQDYIILHEQYHVRRCDPAVKALAYTALCLHWFNPLVWLAFRLSEKDMEMSCDEAVLKKLGEGIRADYSASLLRFAAPHRRIAAMPPTFCENSTKSRICNLLQWKVPQRRILIAATLACAAVLFLCAANPAAKGHYRSMEAFAEHTMAAQKEVSYFTPTGAEKSAQVLDTRLEQLEKQGEVSGLAPGGTLEAWTFQYLVKIDAAPADVALAGGMYEQNGYFDLEGQGGRNLVALRYTDGSYDILYNAPINDNLDFYGYHRSYEEALYDWYVTDRGRKDPLYVKNLSFAQESYPAHRYDGDGWYLYIPVSTWTRAEDGSDSWYSAHETGSALTVYSLDENARDRIQDLTASGFWTQAEDNASHLRHSSGATEDYYYDRPGGGCYMVRIEWQPSNLSAAAGTDREPEFLHAMAESFAADTSLAARTNHKTVDPQTIEEAVNGILVTDAPQTAETYTLTAREHVSGQQNTYLAAPRTALSRDTTPGYRLAHSFTWSPAGAEALTGAEQSAYTLQFSNTAYTVTVYSEKNLLKLEKGGVQTLLTGVSEDDTTPFSTLLSYAVDAEYDRELRILCSVPGSETDYPAIAQALSEQFAEALSNRPDWYGQSAQDIKAGGTEVFDAYYGTDGPNFCFNMTLLLRLSSTQCDHWQAGSGLPEPEASGAYKGYYRWSREVCAAKGADGNWHITQINTGGSFAALPCDVDTATAAQLAELYFRTSGQSRDWRILNALTHRPLNEVQSAIRALDAEQAAQLRQGILTFFNTYPDEGIWSASDLT